jgi:hypothetical protein
VEILIVDISHNTASKKTKTSRRMTEINTQFPNAKHSKLKDISRAKFNVILPDLQFYYYFAAVIATNNNGVEIDMSFFRH